ncbi:MAG: antibiotic biosynthesis monooxygenase [Myxococcales bacterium]|nr:antibiotic biosynthesis monooxygenase [Myxococcales bacterium]
MIIVLIEMAVRAESLSAFEEALVVSLEQRRRAPGNIDAIGYQSLADPTLFTVIERFETQESIDAYYATPEHEAWMDSIASMLLEMKGADQRPIGRQR